MRYWIRDIGYEILDKNVWIRDIGYESMDMRYWMIIRDFV